MTRLTVFGKPLRRIAILGLAAAVLATMACEGKGGRILGQKGKVPEGEQGAQVPSEAERGTDEKPAGPAESGGVGQRVIMGEDGELKTVPGTPPKPPEPEYVEGEIIVKFKEAIAPKAAPSRGRRIMRTKLASIDKLSEKYSVHGMEPVFKTGGAAARKAPGQVTKEAVGPDDSSRVYKIKFPKEFDAKQVAEEYKKDPNVEYAEPNEIIRVQRTPNDPSLGNQWGLKKIQAPEAWDVEKGRPDVVIAIIDTGIDYNHPDLKEKIWRNPGEVQVWANGTDDDGNGYVDDHRGWNFVSVAPEERAEEERNRAANDPLDVQGHGTHVAGIASAATNNGIGIAGTCWNCRLMALKAGYKAVDGFGSLELADIAAALKYAADNGAHVVNMSFGSYGDSSTLRGAIEDAYSKGLVLVAAAGNVDNEHSGLDFYPARYPKTIAVAATDENDKIAIWGLTAFSNYGTWVDVAAPGSGIYSTLPGSKYTYYNGTSMAAPFVSGVAGLLLSRNPRWTNALVASVIKNNVDDISDKNPSFLKNLLGSGRVNAKKAIGADTTPPKVRITGPHAPSARSHHTAVWTGSEMIIWGGDTPTRSGSRYDPVSDVWTPMTTLNAPPGRREHSAVWTGSRMIIWGGMESSSKYSGPYLNDGRMYDPASDKWASLATFGAPSARIGHTAVWTGDGMIVWGGYSDSADPGYSKTQQTGSIYDPVSNRWKATAIATTNSPGVKVFHTAVWIGSRMIVWGGQMDLMYSNWGALYDPRVDSWTMKTTTTGAPNVRARHTAVWTGKKMIIWGGDQGDRYLNSGGVYDPWFDSWSVTGNTPMTGRSGHTAIWTGSRMVVWGGAVGQSGYVGDAWDYDPEANSWKQIGCAHLFPSRAFHTAVWTGSKLIVWGGQFGSSKYNTGILFDPAKGSCTPTNVAMEIPKEWGSKELHAYVFCEDSESGCNELEYKFYSSASPILTCPSSEALYAYSRDWNQQLSPTRVASHQWVCGLAKDNVGNISVSSPVEFKIDRVGPVVSLSGAPANWVTWPLKASVSCADAHSGCNPASYAIYMSKTPLASCPATESPYSVSLSATLPWHWWGCAMARDNAGNIAFSLPVEFKIDQVAPTVSILGAPSMWSRSPVSATISCTDSDSGCDQASYGFHTSIGPLVSCPRSEASYARSPILPVSSHLWVCAMAKDRAGIVSFSGATEFMVDPDPPDTAITKKPSAFSNQRSATFEFISTEPGSGSSFRCRLNGGRDEVCISPRTYTSLAEGNHTFQVGAVDKAGNADPSPAGFSWRVKTTPPDTTITAKPSDPTNKPDAAFSFSSNETGSIFRCRLDTEGYTACTSPKTYAGLSEGKHTFYVKAIDSVGNEDPTPATYAWTIDVTPPSTTFSGTPSVFPTNSTSFTLVFSSPDASATFECQIDGSAFSPCTSPKTYSSLPEGFHTVTVRARDPAGNIGKTVGIGGMFDFTPPVAPNSSLMTVIMRPLGTQDQLSGSAGAVEAKATIKAFSDGLLTTLIGSGLAAGDGSLAPISIGDNQGDANDLVYIVAVDMAGNQSPPANKHNDKTPPETTITAKPPAFSGQTSVTFEFASTEAGSAFTCKLDQPGAPGNFGGCTSLLALTLSKGDGAYTFTVRATDAAGNADPEPATHVWTLDTSLPSSVITSPLNNAVFNNLAAIGGTASDNAGIKLVQVSLQDLAGNTWYDGNSFAGQSEIFLDATGISDWTFAAPAWVHGTKYRIRSRAIDLTGNTEVPGAGNTFTYDATAPGSTITSPANGAVLNTATMITGTAFDYAGIRVVSVSIKDTIAGLWYNGSTFASVGEDWLHAGGPTSQTNITWTYTASAWTSGRRYVVRSMVIDAFGTVETPGIGVTFKFDSGPPDTTITTKPPSPSNSASPSFAFAGTDPEGSAMTFRCQIDGGDFIVCTSPKSFASLTNGSHTFTVKSADAAGNADPTPATYTWTIDTVAPDTTIGTKPPAVSNQATASFSFTCSDPVGAGLPAQMTCTFTCKLDQPLTPGAFTPCASPLALTLSKGDGSYTFSARAIDPAGNMDPTPASYTWTIDTAPPDTTITANPTNPSNTFSATFSFSSTESGATFQCRLDAEGYTSCASPKSYTGLADGSHAFYAVATDTAGNADPTPASYAWTVSTVQKDLTSPVFGGVGSAVAASASQIHLSWAAATDNVTVSASIVYLICQSTTSGACASNFTANYATTPGATSYSVTGLAPATRYFFIVRAVDEAGNADANTVEKAAATASTSSTVTEVLNPWFKDSCGKYHYVYASGGTCYLKNSSDPFGTWDSPVTVGPCEYATGVADRGATCNVHLRVHLAGAGGELRYYRWNGSNLVDTTTVDSWVWCNGIVLDDQDRPHHFWSNSRAYHRSRNADGTWNATTDVSTGAPSGWCPAATIDAGGVWRAAFFRAIGPPDPQAQIYESYSTDNGATWQGLSKVFPDFEAGGWYAWEPSVYMAHRSNNRIMVLRSNRSGKDDLWYTETSGKGWSAPVLWRPLGPDVPVQRRGGLLPPTQGNPALLWFARADDPTKAYYQFRCVGGSEFSPMVWPTKGGGGPVEYEVSWTAGNTPRLFWKEQTGAASWLTTTVAPPSCPGTGDMWVSKAPMPTARVGLAAAVVNGKIYALGGNFAGTNEEYDPARDSWATKKSMPTAGIARIALAAAAVNGKVYTLGGGWATGPESTYFATVEEYDPVTNTWATKASMPTARERLAAAVVNGKIYAIGGAASYNHLATVEEYDPATNTWTTKAPMPTPRRDLAAAVVGGKIYVMGGQPITAVTEMYDPATNTWATKASMPTARCFHAAAEANARIYVIGGDNPTNTLYEYDPVANAWAVKTPMPSAKYMLAAATVDGKIYAIGGGSPATEVYVPPLPSSTSGSTPAAGLGISAGAAEALRRFAPSANPWAWAGGGGSILALLAALLYLRRRAAQARSLEQFAARVDLLRTRAAARGTPSAVVAFRFEQPLTAGADASTQAGTLLREVLKNRKITARDAFMAGSEAFVLLSHSDAESATHSAQGIVRECNRELSKTGLGPVIVSHAVRDLSKSSDGTLEMLTDLSKEAKKRFDQMMEANIPTTREQAKAVERDEATSTAEAEKEKKKQTRKE